MGGDSRIHKSSGVVARGGAWGPRPPLRSQNDGVP